MDSVCVEISIILLIKFALKYVVMASTLVNLNVMTEIFWMEMVAPQFVQLRLAIDVSTAAVFHNPNAPMWASLLALLCSASREINNSTRDCLSF